MWFILCDWMRNEMLKKDEDFSFAHLAFPQSRQETQAKLPVSHGVIRRTPNSDPDQWPFHML